jgi:hypothetical protein
MPHCDRAPGAAAQGTGARDAQLVFRLSMFASASEPIRPRLSTSGAGVIRRHAFLLAKAERVRLSGAAGREPDEKSEKNE